MSAVDSSPPDVPGHLLDRIIGEGASSVVWSGVDQAGEPVAVKVPRPGADPGGHAGAVERHVLSAVRHPHLVPLREVVPLADGRTALVFDLVTGASLRMMVRTRGQLRPGEAVTILTPLSQAVAALHAAGGLHGDVSPGNVMLTAAGRPLLLDLGASHVVGHVGPVWGTEGFVAPEVREGGAPTSASDIFSLGALAWFCLTGNGAPDTVQRLDPATITSHVGPELTEVIAASIDPDPTARPSAAHLAGLFYAAVGAEPVEVVVGADDASALTHRLRADAALEAPEPAQRAWAPRRLIVVGAALGAVVLAVGGWLLLGGSPAAEASRGQDAPDSAAAVTAPVRPEASTPIVGRTTGRSTDGVARRHPGQLQHDVAAPERRTAELLQWLSDRRARALMDRDVDGLAGVHRAGSASHASDVHLVETLLASGDRYADLRLSVGTATWVRGDRERATVRARVGWSDYAVVNRSGARRLRPAASGDVLDFDLRRGPDGWRIEHISVAGST